MEGRLFPTVLLTPRYPGSCVSPSPSLIFFLLLFSLNSLDSVRPLARVLSGRRQPAGRTT